jgi:arylsulfatase A-like enzyme
MRPNLILFMPETVRGDAVFGPPDSRARTPVMDALGREGVAFTRCFSQNPFCTPSRCSLFTGLYPHTHGHRSLLHLLHGHERNLFQDLREAGYRTIVYGKNDLITSDAVPQSFDEWTLRPHTPRSTCPPPPWWNTDDKRYQAFYLGKREPAPFFDYDTACIESALQVIDEPSDKPFCLFLPLSFAHPAYVAEEPYFSLHDRATVKPPAPPVPEGKDPLYKVLWEQFGLNQLTDADFREIRATYFGMISRVDAQLGQLIARLKERNLYDSTALFVFSDHGDFAGDYGMVEKWNCGTDDCLLHVPLIMRVPGRTPAGEARAGLVELLDLYPTILDAAGVEPKHPHFGRSLLAGGTRELPEAGREAVFADAGWSLDEIQCNTPNNLVKGGWYEGRNNTVGRNPGLRTRRATIRTDRYRYVYWPQGVEQLYDLEGDPDALVNRADDPDLATVKRDLRDRILAWLLETSDTTPIAPDPRGWPKA